MVMQVLSEEERIDLLLKRLEKPKVPSKMEQRKILEELLSLGGCITAIAKLTGWSRTYLHNLKK